MAQIRSKQLKLSNPGDMIVADANSNGSILAIGKTEGQALVVKNTGTSSAPVYVLAYDSVAGKFVTYDDSTTQLGATTVQDAIVKLKSSVGGLTGALVYTGTVDASAPTFTPALATTVATGTYYHVTVAGNKIPTNSTNGSTPYQSVLVGDAVVWNGTYWDVISHISTVVAGTTGKITVTGSPDQGYVATIDENYAGQSSITTVGTVTTGTWNGTNIDLKHGGTGTDLSATADNSLLFKSGTGVNVSTPPSGAAVASGSITSFTSNVTNTSALDSDPNANLTVTTGSAAGTGATVTATTTTASSFTISNVALGNSGGTGYATGDTITLTGFAAGTIKVATVDGNGVIQTFDASNLQNAYSSSTNTGASNVTQASTSGAGTGATFTITETGTTTYTVTGFNVTAAGTGYVSGDTLTVKSTIGGSPVTLGTVNITGVSAGQSAAGTTYLSFNPTSGKFDWVDADSIAGSAQQTEEITDQLTFVSGTPGANQTAAGANATVTLSHLPVSGTITVFINGLRLGGSDFTYAVSSSDATKGTITLVDSSLGYSAENGDVIEITYNYTVS